MPIENTAQFDAQTFLAQVPTFPGVYQMYAAEQNLLYVGKAKNLKNRLKSYFNASARSTRIQSMVNQIIDIQYIVTRSEYEALLLESNLIKQHLPKYNILLRDDKSYPYIVLSKHPYPRIHIYRGGRKSSADYFGPYPNKQAVYDIIKFIEKSFQLRGCNDYFFKARSRPCMQYQIGRCSAPCVDLISQKAYQHRVNQVMLFLQGKSQQLIHDLVAEMDEYVLKRAFEQAAVIRDLIQVLNEAQANQTVDVGHVNCDVFAVTEFARTAAIGIQHIRNGQLISHYVKTLKVSVTENRADILDSFVTQFYLSQHTHFGPPDELITNASLASAELLREFFVKQHGHSIQTKISVNGRRREWLLSAEHAAQDYLGHQVQSRDETQRIWREFLARLELPNIAFRMECFDISHTQGEATIGSCVVFDEGRPNKSAYRYFHLTNLSSGDDYEAMRIVLQRRYGGLLEAGERLPDLIVIDGGKGQLSMAKDILQELSIKELPLLGIAKGPTRKAGFEKLYYRDEHTRIDLKPHDPILHLLQHIRDEAHRFAIKNHRKHRAKSRQRSVLETIPGIGEKRRQQLLKHFGGLKGLERASIEDITRVPGVNQALAKAVFAYFHDLA